MRQMAVYRREKNNEKFLKRLIVAISYEWWSLRISSDYRTLTGKSLEGSRLRQVVAHFARPSEIIGFARSTEICL